MGYQNYDNDIRVEFIIYKTGNDYTDGQHMEAISLAINMAQGIGA